ncbi:MAG: hypothetical protein RIR95_703, partial [Pseudomonadota bacterium]
MTPTLNTEDRLAELPGLGET